MNSRNRLKKLIAVSISLILVLSMAACSGQKTDSEQTADGTETAEYLSKDDIEVKNKAQSYVDQINQTLTEQGDKMSPEQKEQLTKLRDEASGAIAANDIDKLREIVGRLEDAAAQAYQQQQQQGAGANPNPEQQQSNNDSPKNDDVVDADFTDSGK